MATILVVDDEPDVVAIVRVCLERDGHSVIGVTSGPAALTNALTRPPDLIVLDLMMPEMDGFEVLRQLKSNPHTASTPVILLTARADYGAKAQAWEMYANHYVTKPFDLDVLSQAVRDALATPSKIGPESARAHAPQQS